MAAFSSWLALVFVTLALIGSVTPADLGKAIRRDTDDASQLREKLHKLHSLLSELYSDDSDKTKEPPKAPAPEPTTTPEPKVNAKAEEVKENQSDNDIKELEDLKAQIASAQEQEKAVDPEKSNYDESIKVLARAIANYRNPKYETKDSTGEYLGTQYNQAQEDLDADKERRMQAVVAKAIEKLKEDYAYGKRIPQNYEDFEEGSFGDFVDQPPEMKLKQPASSNVGTYHSDALKAIELRLMRDLQLASTLGVTVGDLIQDLEAKAYKEAEIREVERRLASLNLRDRR